MSKIKAKLKKAGDKCKNFVEEHEDAIIKEVRCLVTAGVAATLGWYFGTEDAKRCMARGLHNYVSNKVIGIGAFDEDGNFVEVTYDEAVDRMNAFDDATL